MASTPVARVVATLREATIVHVYPDTTLIVTSEHAKVKNLEIKNFAIS